MSLPRLLLALFFAGWATYQFSLVDVGPYSITLLLLASFLLGLCFLRPQEVLRWPLFFLLLSAVLAANVAVYHGVETGEILRDLVQTGIGMTLVMAGTAVPWRRHVWWLRRFFIALTGAVGVYGVYQLAARRFGLPYAFLPITNQQIGSDEGFQRGFVKSLDNPLGFLRASSTFPEPSDLARFMLWIFCFGYTARDRRVGLLLQGIAVLAVVLSQSLGGMIGLLLVVVVDSTLRHRFRNLVLVALLGALSIGVIAAVSPAALSSSTERVGWISSGGVDYLVLTGRFRDVAANWALFAEAPFFGHGLGSLEMVAPGRVVADSIFFLLIERGLVGTLLFVAPFVGVLASLTLASRREERAIATLGWLLLLIEIYHFSTFAAVYFPPLYLALGLAVHVLRVAGRGHSPPQAPVAATARRSSST